MQDDERKMAAKYQAWTKQKVTGFTEMFLRHPKHNI